MRARTIVLLSIGQALSNAGLSLVVLLGGIIGAEIAPSPALATLPVSLQIVGVALATVPAALLMGRIGRRRGFTGAALLAAFGALLAAHAIIERDFLLFCVATLLTGVNGAFVQQYRFAASESVEPRYASRAVSFVLVGGIVAGVLGPELAKRTSGLIPAGLYSGSFVGLALVYLLAAAALSMIQDIRPQQTSTGGVERPLRAIVAQPSYLVAMLAGGVSYGVMSFAMTATPIQLSRIIGYPLEQTAWVVQSHVVAMFLPSLFTGALIDRFGTLRIMLAGVLMLGFCVVLGIISHHLLHYWATLVLLGAGWNFLYVGATVLLTRCYRPVERFKAQAANDFAIFMMQAAASLSSGTIIFSAGWLIINLIILPFLAIALGSVLILRRRSERQQAEEAILGGLLGLR